MSIFDNPLAYVAMRSYHHRHYEGRNPSWYIKKIAHSFLGCGRVLDLGCGPGLCMRALLESGVKEVIGLERDPIFLEEAQKAGLRVISHDLNMPFPFLKSESFDGVILYQTFDFLLGTAKIVCLRECWRVLKPGGKIAIYSQNKFNRNAQKDPCRIGAITLQKLKSLLENSGFHSISLADNKALVDFDSPSITLWTPGTQEELLLTANATAFKPYFAPCASRALNSLSFLEMEPSQRDGKWKTQKPWLYREGAGGLTVLPGGECSQSNLSRSFPVIGELQISSSFEAPAHPPGHGGMAMNFVSDNDTAELKIGLEAGVIWGSTAEILPGGENRGSVSFFVRLEKSEADNSEASLWVWRGDRQVLSKKHAFNIPVQEITVSLQTGPESVEFSVDHVSALNFSDEERRKVFDAQILVSTNSQTSKGRKNITDRDLTELFDRTRVEHALILPGRSHRSQQSFSRVLALHERHPNRTYFLVRLSPTWNMQESVLNRWQSRLEALWCDEQMIGLAFDLPEERPHPAIMEWIEKRQALTVWHSRSEKDMQWLEGAVLKPFRFPVILTSFHGKPAKPGLCRHAVDLIEVYPQLYLNTLFISCGPMLVETASRAPERIVFGSNFPDSDLLGVIADIEELNLPSGLKQKILFDNLDELIREIRFFRQEKLRANRL